MNQTQVEIVIQEIIDDINNGTNEKAVIDRLTFPCRIARL